MELLMAAQAVMVRHRLAMDVVLVALAMAAVKDERPLAIVFIQMPMAVTVLAA